MTLWPGLYQMVYELKTNIETGNKNENEIMPKIRIFEETLRNSTHYGENGLFFGAKSMLSFFP